MKLSKPMTGGRINNIQELGRRYQALEDGTDKGFTVEQIEQSISRLRLKKYGK